MDPIGGIRPSKPQSDKDSEMLSGQPPASQPVTPPSIEGIGSDAPTSVQLPSQQSSASSSTNGNAPKKSSGVAKKILLGLLVILIAAGLAGGGYFVGFSMGKSKGRTEADAEYQRKQAQAQQEAAEDEETSEEFADDAELQLGDLKDPKYVDETIDGEIGKQVSASDGFVLKVTNIERNFTSTDPNYKLDSSKELVKVNFLIGNVTREKAKDIGSFNFRLENASNAQLTPENIASYENKFDTIKLEPGSQAKGSIVYAVNKNETPLKFVREQRYRISSENREVTTRIVITVAK